MISIVKSAYVDNLSAPNFAKRNDGELTEKSCILTRKKSSSPLTVVDQTVYATDSGRKNCSNLRMKRNSLLRWIIFLLRRASGIRLNTGFFHTSLSTGEENHSHRLKRSLSYFRIRRPHRGSPLPRWLTQISIQQVSKYLTRKWRTSISSATSFMGSGITRYGHRDEEVI